MWIVRKKEENIDKYCEKKISASDAKRGFRLCAVEYIYSCSLLYETWMQLLVVRRASKVPAVYFETSSESRVFELNFD